MGYIAFILVLCNHLYICLASVCVCMLFGLPLGLYVYTLYIFKILLGTAVQFCMMHIHT